MSSVITNEGQDWISEKMLDQHDESASIIAVGTSSTNPSTTDSSLGNEVYRGDDSQSNISVSLTSDYGTINARITVSGGTEVSAGTELKEIGFFSSDGSTLIYREVFTGVVINSGDRKTFEFELDVTN